MRNRLFRSLCVLATLVTLAATGCTAQPGLKQAAPGAQPPESGAAHGATEPLPSVPSTTSVTSPAQSARSGVSAKARAYAQSVGGWDHKGETLYLIVGVSVATEREARAALDKALPALRDLQPFFIVQRSDSFRGLTPGPWVVVEAYRAKPSPKNLQDVRRAFPAAQVQRAVVIVSAPVPVYEDLVGGD